jgi:hypothetical protein
MEYNVILNACSLFSYLLQYIVHIQKKHFYVTRERDSFSMFPSPSFRPIDDYATISSSLVRDIMEPISVLWAQSHRDQVYVDISLNVQGDLVPDLIFYEFSRNGQSGFSCSYYELVGFEMPAYPSTSSTTSRGSRGMVVTVEADHILLYIRKEIAVPWPHLQAPVDPAWLVYDANVMLNDADSSDDEQQAEEDVDEQWAGEEVEEVDIGTDVQDVVWAGEEAEEVPEAPRGHGFRQGIQSF